MVEVGDILTIDHEIIGVDGRIVFEPNQKVVVRDLMKQKAHWSRLCPDIWIPEKITGIMLDNIYGIWLPRVFKEFLN